MLIFHNVINKIRHNVSHPFYIVYAGSLGHLMEQSTLLVSFITHVLSLQWQIKISAVKKL